MEKRIRSKAQLEFRNEILSGFFGRHHLIERMRARTTESPEFQKKKHLIEQALIDGTIDIDKLLIEFDLVKYL